MAVARDLARRQPQRHRRHRRRRHVGRHGLRGDEQCRRARCPADRHPQRQRHVDRAADRRDERLSGAARLRPHLSRLARHRQEADRAISASASTAPSPARSSMRAATVTGGTLFEELGFYHIGPIDGHNLEHLLPVLKNVRDNGDGPVLIHVVTQKGKGYAPGRGRGRQISRRQQVRRHHRRAGQGAGQRAELHQGVRRKPDPGGRATTTASSRITAAMPSGTGLDLFGEAFPVADLRCRHCRAACRDLCRRPGQPKASSRSPRSIRPSCSAPTTRSSTTWRSRNCRCASRSTAPASSAPTARPIAAPSTRPFSPRCPASW